VHNATSWESSGLAHELVCRLSLGSAAQAPGCPLCGERTPERVIGRVEI
jgi:hypothetical protein